jgi:hypothetical protein
MRVVVGLSTIPSREESVLKTIASLRQGNYKPDAIYVCLPEWYPRFKCAPKPGLADAITGAGGTVLSCKDTGVFTKLLPVLEVEQDPFTVIITGDDDATYTPNFIEGLLYGYDQFHCPVGYSGIAYPETSLKICGKLGYHIFAGHGSPVEILETSFGILIPRWAMYGFPTVKPYTLDSDKCLYFSDDYLYSKFWDAQGIPKRLLCFDQIGRRGDDWSSIMKFNEGAQECALSKDENNLSNFLKAGEKFKFVQQTLG